MKINAWWKVPHGKLIGSPGRFFNHNRLWHPPGLGVFARGSRLADGGQRGAWGGGGIPRRLTQGPVGETHACRSPARLGDRVVREGSLETQTWFESSSNTPG